MTTIKDVAKKAGVSVATVSHVVNGTRYVSDQFKTKVRSAMDELNYQPNALARSLRRKESKIIGLMIPDSTNPYFAEIAWSIEYASKKEGYSVILCNSDGNVNKESSYIDVLIENQADGIIIVAAGKSSVNFQKLLDRKIPVVMVDRDSPNVKTDSIQINNAVNGELAADHLISLHHKQIACITGPREVSPSFDRLDGYKRALSKNNLPLNEDFIIRGDFKPHGGYLAGIKLLEMQNRPTAIFACNDLMAYGVMRAAVEKGFQVPDDLSVIGFDDIYLSTYINPPLTTIKQPRIEMGEEAVFSLINRIKDPDRIARRIYLDATLVVRSSTKDVK
jgi:LacI family transcriptional regulator